MVVAWSNCSRTGVTDPATVFGDYLAVLKRLFRFVRVNPKQTICLAVDSDKLCAKIMSYATFTGVFYGRHAGCMQGVVARQYGVDAVHAAVHAGCMLIVKYAYCEGTRNNGVWMRLFWVWTDDDGDDDDIIVFGSAAAALKHQQDEEEETTMTSRGKVKADVIRRRCQDDVTELCRNVVRLGPRKLYCGPQRRETLDCYLLGLSFVKPCWKTKQLEQTTRHKLQMLILIRIWRCIYLLTYWLACLLTSV